MLKNGDVLLALVAILCSGGINLVAAPVNVINPSFEDISGESPFNEFTFGPLNGWGLHDPENITSGGAGNVYYIGTLTPFQPDPVGNPGVYANFPDGASHGQRVGIAFNFFGSGEQGEYGFEQQLDATLQPNTQYTLQVDIGNIASATARSGDFFDLDGFPGYRVDLLAGGVPVAQDINSLAGSVDDGEFGTSTIVFTTGYNPQRVDQALGIRLVNLNHVDPLHPDSDLEVDFDNVRLDDASRPDGDYNQDGVTDAADYVMWRRNQGDQPEYYDVWRKNFGNVHAPGAGSGSLTVPEPHVAALVMLGAATVWRIRRRCEC